MIKQILFLGLISFLFSSFISLFFALALYLLGYNFLISFLILLSLTLLIGSVLNIIIEQIFNFKYKKLLLKKENENLNQSINVACSYCKEINYNTPIKLGQKNIFKCKYCNQDNLITIYFGSAQIYKPINGQLFITDYQNQQNKKDKDEEEDNEI